MTHVSCFGFRISDFGFPPVTFLDNPTPVRDGESLNAPALHTCLREHFSLADDPLEILQFPGGYSNLTYLIRCGSQEWVLRRPPFGNRVKSAHDMEREFRILSKLWTVYPPAPRPHFYCGDERVLGAPFYVMERRRGIVLRGPIPPELGLDAAAVGRLGAAFVENLAALHALDFRAAGLGDLGRPEGYVERQIAGWTRRWADARTDELPEMERVGAWLADHRPGESGAALIHNDYKYDNLMLDPADPTRITTLLDWEMATVGDPLMDLGATLAYWVEASDPPDLRAASFGPTAMAGSPTRAELVRMYEARTGRRVGDGLFGYVYGLHRLAVIVQQIYARFVRGHTRDARFERLHERVAALARAAARAIERGTISPP
jgi:aminoglycoside phosphotransferase (APT) family kinase protein